MSTLESMWQKVSECCALQWHKIDFREFRIKSFCGAVQRKNQKEDRWDVVTMAAVARRAAYVISGIITTSQQSLFLQKYFFVYSRRFECLMSEGSEVRLVGDCRKATTRNYQAVWNSTLSERRWRETKRHKQHG